MKKTRDELTDEQSQYAFKIGMSLENRRATLSKRVSDTCAKLDTLATELEATQAKRDELQHRLQLVIDEIADYSGTPIPPRGTYAEKWEAMSEMQREIVSEDVDVALRALINQRDNIRLNDEFKSWAAKAILQTVTKNHATLHDFKQFCEEQERCPFETLELCIQNYEQAAQREPERTGGTEKDAKENMVG